MRPNYNFGVLTHHIQHNITTLQAKFPWKMKNCNPTLIVAVVFQDGFAGKSQPVENPFPGVNLFWSVGAMFRGARTFVLEQYSASRPALGMSAWPMGWSNGSAKKSDDVCLKTNQQWT
jgi:hypothetical protein